MDFNRILIRDYLRERLTTKRLIAIFIISIVVISAIFVLRANPNYDIGGYELPNSPSINWSTNSEPQADFSNDDTWNQSYLWAHESSSRMCKGDLAESDPYQLNGSSYAAVGSTMATNPQLLATCIVPVPQKSLLLLLLNSLLAGLGMYFCIRLLFTKSPAWLGLAFPLVGTMMVYGVWPHTSSFAWVPLGIYTTCVLILKPITLWRLALAVLVQVCLLLSGQPEVTLLGFITIYVLIIAILISKRYSIMEAFRKILPIGLTSISSIGIAAFALVPIALNALSSDAATSRTNVSFITWSAQRTLIKAHAREGIFQFLDPGLFSDSNPYRTVISLQPYSRLSAWVGTLMICIVLSVLVFERRKKLLKGKQDEIREPSQSQDAEVLSIIRTLSFFGFCSFLFSLRIPWLEFVCSKVTILNSPDRNIFRYLTVVFIFIAAMGCLHILTKRIIVWAFFAFVVTRVSVFVYMYVKADNLQDETKEIRDFLHISYSTIVYQRLLIIFLSLAICSLVIFGLTRSSLNTLRVCIALAVFIELSQIISIHPQNWSEVKPSPTAKEVQSDVRKSGERLLLPKTYFATAGTWLQVPTITGYSIISEDESKIVQALDSCTIDNDFFFTTCGYNKDDSQVFNASNVGWVITFSDMKADTNFYFGDLTKMRELKNGFALYKRNSHQSPAFSIDDRYCSGKMSSENIKNVDIVPIDSELIYAKEDPDNIKATSKSFSSCVLLSLTFDESYKVSTESHELETKSVGGFLAVKIDQKDVSKLSLVYVSPGRSLGTTISIFTFAFLLIGIMTTVLLKKKRKLELEKSSDAN